MAKSFLIFYFKYKFMTGIVKLASRLSCTAHAMVDIITILSLKHPTSYSISFH